MTMPVAMTIAMTHDTWQWHRVTVGTAKMLAWQRWMSKCSPALCKCYNPLRSSSKKWCTKWDTKISKTQIFNWLYLKITNLCNFGYKSAHHKMHWMLPPNKVTLILLQWRRVWNHEVPDQWAMSRLLYKIAQQGAIWEWPSFNTRLVTTRVGTFIHIPAAYYISRQQEIWAKLQRTSDGTQYKQDSCHIHNLKFSPKPSNIILFEFPIFCYHQLHTNWKSNSSWSFKMVNCFPHLSLQNQSLQMQTIEFHPKKAQRINHGT